jgi:hypothetical protein
MKQKKAQNSMRREIAQGAPVDRREFERLGLPGTAFMFDESGNELGRVTEIGGGGLQLSPASPWARATLIKGQQLIVTIVEPASGNETEIKVEVRYVRSNQIGLCFL